MRDPRAAAKAREVLSQVRDTNSSGNILGTKLHLEPTADNYRNIVKGHKWRENW